MARCPYAASECPFRHGQGANGKYQLALMADILNPWHKAREKARPSFLKELLEDPEVCSDPEKLDIVKWGAASLYASASDTVIAVNAALELSLNHS